MSGAVCCQEVLLWCYDLLIVSREYIGREGGGGRERGREGGRERGRRGREEGGREEGERKGEGGREEGRGKGGREGGREGGGREGGGRETQTVSTSDQFLHSDSTVPAGVSADIEE